jgi:hypothetical protein
MPSALRRRELAFSLSLLESPEEKLKSQRGFGEGGWSTKPYLVWRF